jgi:CheY-like chemotaxis protein
MDGYALARNMRALAGGEKMILVAVTGYGRDQDRRAARAAGFDHHLAKPVDEDTLQRIVGQPAGTEPGSEQPWTLPCA